MRLNEAHRQLADMVGDTVPAISDIAIPDGVRFTATMRGSALYIGMINVYKKMLDKVIVTGAPREVQAEVLERAFPNSTISAAYVLPDGNNQSIPLNDFSPANNSLYFIYAAKWRDMSATGTQGQANPDTPLPIKTANKAYALLNSKNVQRHDAFITHRDINGVSQIVFYADGEQATGDIIDISYLRYPEHPNVQLENAQYTADLDIEEVYVENVLMDALWYLHHIDQDSDSIDMGFVRNGMDKRRAQ